LPDLVDAASRGIAGSNLTVLGASGVNEILAGLVGQGLAVLELLRTSTAAASAPMPAAAPPVSPPAPSAAPVPSAAPALGS